MAEQPFTEADIRKVFSSNAGQQLLKLLNQDGGAALRQAADALKRGDQAAAMAAVAPLMETAEAKTLVDRLNRK